MKEIIDSRVRCPEGFMNRREQRKRSSVQLSSPLSPLAPVQAFPKIMIPHRVRIHSETADCGAKHRTVFGARCAEEFLNRREQRKQSSVQRNSPLPLLASVPVFPKLMIPHRVRIDSETADCGAKHRTVFGARCAEEVLNRRKQSSEQRNSPLPLLPSVQAFPNKRLPDGATTMSEARKVVS